MSRLHIGAIACAMAFASAALAQTAPISPTPAAPSNTGPTGSGTTAPDVTAPKSTTAPATAQSPTTTLSPATTQSTEASKAPLPGKNSFTEGQARERIQKAGFNDVKLLKQDENGIWRGEAQKSGQPVKVALDFRGNVVQQ